MESNKVKAWISRGGKALLCCTMFQLGLQDDLCAQTFAEIFKQKKTQKKYLLEQIAALQVFTGYVRQGYQIAGQGLEAIGSFSGEEKALHNAFFDHRRGLLSGLASSPTLARLMYLKEALEKSLTGNPGVVSELSPSQRDYVKTIWKQLRSRATIAAIELEQLTRKGALELEDQQRLSRLQELLTRYEEMREFSCFFTAQLLQLSGEQKRMQRELTLTQTLYEKED